MRPRPTLLSAALAAAVLLPACADVFDTAAAVVDGERIDDEALHRQLDFLLAGPLGPEEAPSAEQRAQASRQFLTFLIHQEVVDRYAAAEDIRATEAEIDRRLEELFVPDGDRTAFEDLLERSGATPEDVRELVRQQIVRQRVFEAVAEDEVSDETLREAYRSRLDEFTQVEVAHILVSDQGRARELARRVTVENFGEMAERFSEDPSSAERGGDLGLVRPVEQVEPFARAALEAEVGTVVGPVETQFGFHLIHVRSRETVPFEEVAPDLRRQLAGESFGRWILGRVREADIRVNPRYGMFDRSSGQVVERRSTADQPEAPATP